MASMEREQSNRTVKHEAARDAGRAHRHAVMGAERQHVVQLAKAKKMLCKQLLASLVGDEGGGAAGPSAG